MVSAAGLPSRFYPLRHHPEQARLRHSTARFKVVEAGRRSGKTEHAKRDGVEELLQAPSFTKDPADFRVGFFAPTRDQAKQIYWEDLKRLVPAWLVSSISETELSITTLWGSSIWVVGLDKPARVEGRAWWRVYWDEVADCKPGVWDRHIRPALDTDGVWGKAWIYGVPRPSSEFKRLADLGQDPDEPDYDYFHWKSSEILPEEAVAAAKRTMDPLLFAQEYEASRINLQGLAYYQFSRDLNLEPVPYDPRADIYFCFDFNVSPGTATVIQNHPASVWPERDDLHDDVTGGIGEVWIPKHSNTKLVCERLIEDWGEHRGRIIGEGDATGGNPGSAQLEGSDWDIIDDMMTRAFGDRWRNYTPESNPPVRSRVNAVNARLRTADERVGFLIDETKAPKLIEDFEGVMVLEGTTGELDKKSDLERTHSSDGVGYHIERKYPVVSRETVVGSFM